MNVLREIAEPIAPRLGFAIFSEELRAFFAYAFDVSEALERFASRGVGRHAARDVCLDPSFPRHAVEGGVERSLLDAQHVVGGGFDPAGDAVAVHRAPGQRLEDEELDGSLEEAGIFSEHGLASW